MAELIGGIGASHSPSIAFAWDQRHDDRPEWKPFFDAAAMVRAQVARSRPDVLVFLYNDHLWQFDLDLVPTFAIGVAPHFPLAPERERNRPLPGIAGDEALAWHLTRSLVAAEFDLTVCRRMTLDHGFFSVLPLLVDPPAADAAWPVTVVPIAVNVIQGPLPTPRRLWKLGRALGEAIRGFPADRRVMVVATGGLSHQLHGPDFGTTTPDWDRRFLELLVDAPDELAALTHDDYMRRGGVESVEMMVWLAMRGALASPGLAHRAYHPGKLTGLGLLHLLEDSR